MPNNEQPTGDIEQLAQELAELRAKIGSIDDRLVKLESSPIRTPTAASSQPISQPDLIAEDEGIEVIEATLIDRSEHAAGEPESQLSDAAFTLQPDVQFPRDNPQRSEFAQNDLPSPFIRDAKELLSEHWEQIVGGRWMTWAGAITLIVAMGFFVPWAWTQLDLPAWIKVLLLHSIGIGISLAALVLHQRGMRVLAQGLAGVGIFSLYACAWAAQHHYSVWGESGNIVVFMECAVITAITIAAAVTSRSVAIVLLGALGGYLTPIIAGGDKSMHIALFSYLAFLNVALVGSAVLRSWSFLKPLALLATVSMFALWLFSGSLDGELHTWSTQWLLSLHWLIFLLGATLPPLLWQRSSNRLDLFALSLNSLWFISVTWSLFHVRPDQQLALVCWAMTVLHLALLGATYNRVTNVDRMPRMHLALAAIFFILAMPLQLEDSLSYLGIAWGAQGVVLSAVGIYFRDRQMCVSSLVVFGLACLRLMIFDYLADPTMLGNLDSRFVMFLVTSLLMILGGTFYPLAARFFRKEQDNASFWEPAGGALIVVGNLLAMIGLTCQWDSRLVLLLWTIDAAAIWGAGFVMPRFKLDGSLVRTYGLCLGVLLVGARTIHEGDAIAGDNFVLLWNDRFATLLLISVVYFAAAWCYRKLGGLANQQENAFGFGSSQEVFLGSVVAVLANQVLVVALSLEIHNWFELEGQFFVNKQMAEQAAYSILFAIYAAVAVTLGLAFRWPVMRYLGLLGFVLTLVKVFFVDLASLELLPRVLALAVLGVTLLAVSFVYQRFQAKIDERDV